VSSRRSRAVAARAVATTGEDVSTPALDWRSR
jgi:hypothetical protein